MISWHDLKIISSVWFKKPSLGVPGYLSIFAASLAAVMFASSKQLAWVAGSSLLIAALAYPRAFHRLMQWRWLMMIGLLAFPPLFLVGETDHSLLGIQYSSEGLTNALQIALRILVILVSVQGLTEAVDITSITGLLEQAGLHGLGFSVGVAFNLLPALLQSAQNAWHSLHMRGGLRRRRWRALQLLAVMIIANALYRAEETSIAAETRAFSPEKSLAYPIKSSKLDWLVITLALLSIGVIITTR